MTGNESLGELHSATEGESAADPVTDSQKAYITLLFNKYRAPLFRYLTRFVTVDDAGELVQEAYFRLLRHGNMVQLEAMARSFLFQTATNLARDHHRRRVSHHASDHVSLDSEPESSTAIEPADHLAGEQVLSALESTLQRMSDDTRRVFLLHRFRDMSYEEIGAAMGLSTRTVARKMAEAMDRLADAVRDRP